MRLALVTTTIHVPQALALYRKLDADVAFFVAGDLKTPNETGAFCEALPACFYFGPLEQQRANWKCSELVGWNTIRRRAIAVLEALKWRADVIVSWDDDNLPMSDLHFNSFMRLFIRAYENIGQVSVQACFNGLEAFRINGWFDPGALLVPPIKHRGFPIATPSELAFQTTTGVRIGLAEGLILGDTDMDAVTRIVSFPTAHSIVEMARAGIVTNPRHTWTVCNTQNTAYLAELAPAMFCMPDCGRFDDIYASLITQRVMAERGLHVHFGPPFVWQQRNKHNLLTDLREEIDGMENIRGFANYLRRASIAGESVIDDCRALVGGCALLSDHAKETAFAFYDDVLDVTA